MNVYVKENLTVQDAVTEAAKIINESDQGAVAIVDDRGGNGYVLTVIKEPRAGYVEQSAIGFSV